MYSQLSILALPLLLRAAVAITLRDLPACAAEAYANAVGQTTCPPRDLDCVCNNDLVKSAFKTKVPAKCSGKDLLKAVNIARQVCPNLQINLISAAPSQAPKSPEPTTPPKAPEKGEDRPNGQYAYPTPAGYDPADEEADDEDSLPAGKTPGVSTAPEDATPPPTTSKKPVIPIDDDDGDEGPNMSYSRPPSFSATVGSGTDPEKLTSGSSTWKYPTAAPTGPKQSSTPSATHSTSGAERQIGSSLLGMNRRPNLAWFLVTVIAAVIWVFPFPALLGAI